MKIKYFFFRAFKLIIFIFSKLFNLNFTREQCGIIYIRYLSKIKKIYKINLYGQEISYDITTDIGGNLYLYGVFEKEELERCKKYIKKDSTIIDIGANIGLHSIFYASKTNGSIFSFEPSRETYKILLKNIKKIENIFPFNVAISNANRIMDFYEANDNAYSGLKDTKRKTIKKISKVITYRLDDIIFLLNLEKIDFIKIDVEGFEQEVLEGMNEIIRKYKPIIYCEIYKGINSNKEPEHSINYLKKFGYNVYVFRENNFIEFQEHIDIYHNYFFLPN